MIARNGLRLVGLGVCALLAACNVAFGLDPTIAVDAALIDFDQDRVMDSMDNCPTVANADQANTDGDAFGDACDTCLVVASASNHDEDQDAVGDACDLCPGVEDFNDDSDGDALGDICDPDKDMPVNARLMFEPFVTTPPEWQPSGVSWTSLGDEVAPAMDLPPNDDGLAHTTIVATAPWTATIGYVSNRPWAVTDRAAIEAKVAGHTIRCQQDCPTPQCRGALLVDGAVVSLVIGVRPRPFSHITFRVTALNALTCEWNDASSMTQMLYSVTGPATFSVIAGPNVHVTYFEYLK